MLAGVALADADASTFDPDLFAQNLDAALPGNVVGYGYAITRDAEIAAEGGGGQSRKPQDGAQPYTSTTRQEIASVSKTITAVATLKMLQDQVEGVLTPIGEYLPQAWVDAIDDPAKLALNFRQLMTHTSGIPDGDAYRSFGALQGFMTGDTPLQSSAFAYTSTNYSLLRVALPYLWDAGQGGPSSAVLDRDESIDNLPGPIYDAVIADWGYLPEVEYTTAMLTASVYKHYVQTRVFEPLGIDDADTDHTQSPPTLLYPDIDLPGPGGTVTIPGVTSWFPGFLTPDQTLLAGARGWNLSAQDLATFMIGIRQDSGIISPLTRSDMDENYFGWMDPDNGYSGWTRGAFGDYYGHSGDNFGAVNTAVLAFPNDVEAALVMNSNTIGGLPYQGRILKDAYENAFTEIVVNGTSDADYFSFTLNGSNYQLIVNGNQENMIVLGSNLQKLIVNGLGGNDTFNIQDLPAGLEVEINGQQDNDTVYHGGFFSGDWDTDILGAVVFDGGSGTDTLNVEDTGDGVGADTYTVTKDLISKTSQPGATIDYATSVETIDLYANGLNNTINVDGLRSGRTLTVFAGAGNDTIKVASGSSGSSQDLDTHIDGTLIVYGGGQADDTLAVYDRDDWGSSDFYTITDDTVDKSYITPIEYHSVAGVELYASNQRDNTINIRSVDDDVTVSVWSGALDDTIHVSSTYHDLDSYIDGDLILNGEDHSVDGDEVIYHDESDAGGADTYDFDGTYFTKSGAGQSQHLGFEQITLMASDLASTINVRAFGTALGDDHLFISTGAGFDEVVLGEVDRDLDLIRGHVVVVAPPGSSDTVTLDDRQNQAGRTFTFDPLHVSADGAFGSLTHLHVAAVDVKGGPYDDVFNVSSVAGNDLELQGYAGPDVFNISDVARDLDSIGGKVKILGGSTADLDQAFLFDENDDGDDTYTLDVDGNYGTVSRGAFLLEYLAIDDLNLYANDGANHILIEAGPLLADYLNVYAGVGDDTIDVTPTSGDLSDLDGLFANIYGGPDTDTLNVVDINSWYAGTYTVTDDQVDRQGAHPVTYDEIEQLNLDLSHASTPIAVDSTAPGTDVFIDGNWGNDDLTVVAPSSDVVFDGGVGILDEATFVGTHADDAIQLFEETISLGKGSLTTDHVDARRIDGAAGYDVLTLLGSPGEQDVIHVQASANPNSGDVQVGASTPAGFENVEAIDVDGNKGDGDRLIFDGSAADEIFNLDLAAAGTNKDPVLTLHRPVSNALLLILLDFDHVLPPQINGNGGADIFNVAIADAYYRDVHLDGGSPSGVPQGDELHFTFAKDGALVQWLPNPFDASAGAVKAFYGKNRIFEVIYEDFEFIDGLTP